MSFLAWLVSDNSRSLEKIELGALSSPATCKEHILHEVWVLFSGHLRVRYKRFSQIEGPEPLLKITLEGRILHRFWDIAFDTSNVAIFFYPSCG